MRLLTRPVGAVLTLCLCPSLLTTVQAEARAERVPALSTRMDDSRQATIDTFYDRWLRNNLEPVSWTGSTDTCTPGATSAAAEAATIDQINFYRELVGSPPATVDQVSALAPQRAALMMHANGDLDHYPPPTWRCYAEPFDHNLLSSSPAAQAIVSYMNDFGPQNISVGHRRALIDPWVRSYAVGSTDRFNAILITGHNTEESTSTGWVAWPPAGLLASPLAPSRWSIDTLRPELNLSNASATVKGPAGAFTPAVLHRSSRGIVFEVVPDFAPPVGVDAMYEVTISGITQDGAAAPDHTYVTTLVRPDRPVVAAAAPALSGTPRVGSTLVASPTTWLTPGTRARGNGWYRDDVRIPSTSGQLEYRLSEKDLGHRVRYTEIGEAQYYLPSIVSSAAVVAEEGETPAPRTLKLIRKPRVRGEARVGQVLRVRAGTWQPHASSAYRWVRGGKVVARTTRLRLTKAYGGKKVVLRVLATRPGYETAVLRITVGRVRR